MRVSRKESAVGRYRGICESPPPFTTSPNPRARRIRSAEALPRHRPVYVYCRSGFRAHLAVRILKELGFEDVVNVTGGELSMRAEGGFDWERA